MDKQLFDDAIGEVPPSTVDVAAVITRGRRADRVRRLASPAVAAGLAVVLVSGAVAITMTRGGSGGVGVGSTSSTEQDVAVPPTTLNHVEACSRPDLESPAQVSARLTGLLTPLVQAQRPDLGFEENQLTAGHGPLEVFQARYDESPPDPSICDEGSFFSAAATTKEPGGDGFLLVVVRPDFHDHPGSADCTNPGFEQSSCQEVTGPHGEAVVMRTLTTPADEVEHRVDIDRPDGTQVTISSATVLTSVDGNGVSVKSEPVGGPPTAPAPPLTLDQLVAIGTDPGLTLFP